MRSSRIIVPGVFYGATIEPGTFHDCHDAMFFRDRTLDRRVSDGESQREADVAGPFPIGAQLRSAPGEDTSAPIPPNTERAADATPN